MTTFDSSQLRVLELDPARHARVLGAPGTGKTTLLLESYERLRRREGWGEHDVLILAANRLVARALRSRISQRLDRATGGTPVRTLPSLAFSVLHRCSALRAEPAPRLLTGTAQDEMSEKVLRDVLDGAWGAELHLPYAPEVLMSEAFRGELRELSRVLDDFALEPDQLEAHLVATSQPAAQAVPALALVREIRDRLQAERPQELTSSAMLRAASDAVRLEHSLELPRIVLIDDAAELGEGGLALLAALADRGIAIWAFGDPDTATGAFHGERARLLAGIETELRRRQHVSSARSEPEQLVVLEQVYRHGSQIRELVRSLASRVGTAGAGAQRAASSVRPSQKAPRPSESDRAVVCATAASPAEQVGVIAHRLRAAHLGLGGGPRMPWSKMVVICRSRGEVARLSRLLAGHQVPTGVAAGGVVLRDHQLVRELVRLLQHALGLAPLGAREVTDLLGGVVGGLDPIALRRLRSALRLQEVRAAKAEQRDPASADELVLEAFTHPGTRPVIDMRAARSLMRLGRLVAEATAVHQAGGTPREVLWQLWSGTGLAEPLQQSALEGRGTRSDEAHRTLDAVVGLFFALQRHEELDSDRPIGALLEDILTNSVPEDTLAARSEREAVTVTTAQGTIGQEYDLVCIVGPQEGTWPNLRARGSLLGVSALERWLRGDAAELPSRRDTLHDELRLLVQSCSRAREQLLLIAIANEDEQPSSFFSIASAGTPVTGLPSNRLTLRGVVAEMRRRLTVDQHDTEALHSLAALAHAGVPGAHPDEWYGVQAPSSTTPLADIDRDEQATVSVSPSQIERVETCPLDWFISRLGGDSSDYRTEIGTLVHRAFEHARTGDTAEQLLGAVVADWETLRFDALWQSNRALEEARAMTRALAEYLRAFEASRSDLVAKEAPFTLAVDFARLRGSADRIEARAREDGGIDIVVVDLKTGRRTPSAKDLQQHAQLQAYQLGALRGAFRDENGEPLPAADRSEAKLLYVHPDSVTKTRRAAGEQYVEVAQAQLGEDEQAAFEQRVREVGRLMAGSRFIAQVEHHCEQSQTPNRVCALHIIPAVSHA